MLTIRNIPLIDTFQFGGPQAIPATANVTIRWTAPTDPVTRGFGDAVDPTDPGAFLGELPDPRAVARLSFTELGFAARSIGTATSDLGFAEVGTERNGVFLD